MRRIVLVGSIVGVSAARDSYAAPPIESGSCDVAMGGTVRISARVRVEGCETGGCGFAPFEWIGICDGPETFFTEAGLADCRLQGELLALRFRVESSEVAQFVAPFSGAVACEERRGDVPAAVAEELRAGAGAEYDCDARVTVRPNGLPACVTEPEPTP